MKRWCGTPVWGYTHMFSASNISQYSIVYCNMIYWFDDESDPDNSYPDSPEPENPDPDNPDSPDPDNPDPDNPGPDSDNTDNPDPDKLGNHYHYYYYSQSNVQIPPKFLLKYYIH